MFFILLDVLFILLDVLFILIGVVFILLGVLSYRYCLLCCDEREFFIEKAIGWALRQYFRYGPDDVKRFVEDNKHRLARLSIKEALKHA